MEGRMMETIKRPYEVLIRFDQDGAVRGAHVIWRYMTVENGIVVSDTPGAPVAAGEAGADFPLSAAVNSAIEEGLRLSSAALDQLQIAREDMIHAINTNKGLQADLDETSRLIAEMRAKHSDEIKAMGAELDATRLLAGLSTASEEKARATLAARAATVRAAAQATIDKVDQIVAGADIS